MNPSKVAVSLLFLTMSLLLLSGCEEMMNNPAPPNPETGIKPSPFDSGLRIAFAQATPLFSDFMGKGAAVNVHFNGAATTTVYVDVAAQYPGSTSWTGVGMGRLDPGQRDVQVRIKMDVKEPGQFPLKVSTRPYSGSYITMTSYRG